MQTEPNAPLSPASDNRPLRPLSFGRAPHPDEIAAYMADARRLRAEAAADLAAGALALLSRRRAPTGTVAALR